MRSERRVATRYDKTADSYIGKESEWFPLKPELVVKVSYDQVTDDRFRHGTGLVRWRPDKAPGHRMEQLGYALRPSDVADIS